MVEIHHKYIAKLTEDFGGDVARALQDPSVIEICANPDGSIWVDTYDGMRLWGEISGLKVRNVINTVASILGVAVARENPAIETEIRMEINNKAQLVRFIGLIPPVCCAPAFVIRKPFARVLPLNQFLEDGVVSLRQYEIIKEAVKTQKTILIAGGTCSGKTTLANAILHELSLQYPADRVVIIEDTIELQCHLDNKIQLRTSEYKTMDDLLRCALRLRPDRIVVGEVRGREASALIKAWNTGHPGGLSTIHANSAYTGLLRIEQLILEANVQPSRVAIAEAIDYIVFIEKRSDHKARRQITGLLQVQGYDEAKKEYQIKVCA